MKKPLPSQEALVAMLDYNAETGDLTWRPRDVSAFVASATRSAQHVANLWNVRYAGKPALANIEREGYRKGTIDGVYYKAHRIIWKMMHGADPDSIDHINGVRSDNRLINLRSVSEGENLRNKAMPSSNTSGRVGVSRNGNVWVAYIGTGAGRQEHLGTFLTKAEAVAARQAAEALCGFHQNHGRLPEQKEE